MNIAVIGAGNVGVVTRVVIIALPAPPAADGSADLAQIDNGLRDLARSLSHGAVVALKSTVPDISVARSALEWEPVVPFVDGLRRTIAYLQDLRR